MKPGWRVRRLHDGSGLVAKRIGKAFVPEERPVATVVRCGAALYLGPHLLTLAHQSPVWLIGGTCAWCVAAWRAKPEKATEAEPADNAEGAESPAYTDAEIRTAVQAVAHAAVAGRNGVHIKELLGELQRVGLLGSEVTVADLRRSLERWGIPTRDSVKVAGLNKPGVHRDDLQPLSQPLPQPALADAG